MLAQKALAIARSHQREGGPWARNRNTECREEPYSYEVRGPARARSPRVASRRSALPTSAVFDNAAERYVAGDISARQLSDIVDDYYDQKVDAASTATPGGRLVSARICDAWTPTGSPLPATLRAIHGASSAASWNSPSTSSTTATNDLSEFVQWESYYGDYASSRTIWKPPHSRAVFQGGDPTRQAAPHESIES